LTVWPLLELEEPVPEADELPHAATVSTATTPSAPATRGLRRRCREMPFEFMG
jgi:hypothetical protein